MWHTGKMIKRHKMKRPRNTQDWSGALTSQGMAKIDRKPPEIRRGKEGFRSTINLRQLDVRRP